MLWYCFRCRGRKSYARTRGHRTFPAKRPLGSKMTFRRLCGYDLNGWRDRAARNWTIGADGDEPPEVHLTGWLLFSAVFRMDTAKEARWIGGLRLNLHRMVRGAPWGDVGSPDRRRLMIDVLNDEGADVAHSLRHFQAWPSGPKSRSRRLPSGPTLRNECKSGLSRLWPQRA